MTKLNFTNNGLPMHLGGHEETTWVDEGVLDLLINKFDIKSMVDVGCGPGGMVEHARSKGLEVLGVDGDFVVERNITDVVIHDYTTGPYVPEKSYDLAWTCEFVEHVDAKYVRNFVSTFDKCKYVVMTHALPGQAGWNHINCQPIEYWIHVLLAFGFEIDVETTNQVRAASTITERYFREQSLFLRNLNFKED